MPIAELAAVAAEFDVPMHSDAVQAVGQLPVDLRGERAVGDEHRGAQVRWADGCRRAAAAPRHRLRPATARRRPGTRRPLWHTGCRGRGRRWRWPPRWRSDGLEAHRASLPALRDRLVDGVLSTIDDVRLNGADGRSDRLPGNAHFTFRGCEGDALLMLLDANGIECSTGSACTAGVAQPSHVLMAMGADPAAARGSLRLSLGHTSIPDDVDAVLGRAARCGGSRAAGGAGQCGSVESEGSGRDERRRRLVGRRRPDGRRRARRGRRAPRAVVRAGHTAHRVARLLLEGRRRRRSAGRGRPRTSRSTSGISPTGSTTTSSTTSCRRMPAARRRTRACGATRRSSSRRCGRARWRWASTRWPPVTTRGCRTGGCGAPSTRDKDQSYVLAVLTAEQLRHALFPMGDTPKPHDSGRGGGARARGRATSPTATTSASSRPATPRRSSAPHRRAPRRGGRRGRARCWPTRRRARLHRSASARVSASRVPDRTGGRGTSPRSTHDTAHRARSATPGTSTCGP